MRLLVTSTGSTAAQNLIWALRRENEWRWFVVGADIRARHGGLGLADLDVTLPRGDAPGYLDALVELVEAQSVEVVVPVMEPELVALAGAPGRLPPTARALVSPSSSVALCQSKRRLQAALAALGLDTPAVIDAPGPRDFPLFVRPDLGTGSVGAQIVEDLESWRRLTARGDWVTTELLEGEQFSIDGFAGEGGSLHYALCRRRELVRNGLALRSTVTDLGARREQVALLARRLGLLGFFNLQLLRTPSGREAYHDLNPRLGGAMALSFAAGLDAPRLLRAWRQGAPPPALPPPRIGLELHRRWHNLLLPPSDR